MIDLDHPFRVYMDCGHTDVMSLDEMQELFDPHDHHHLCPVCGDRQHVYSFRIPTGWRWRLLELVDPLRRAYRRIRASTRRSDF